jgi:hypothetical protein
MGPEGFEPPTLSFEGSWRSCCEQDKTAALHWLRHRDGCQTVLAIVLISAGVGTLTPSAQASSRTLPLSTIEAYVSNAIGVPVTISCEPDASFELGVDGYVLQGGDGSILPVIHIRQSECAAAQSTDRKRAKNPTQWTELSTTGQRDDEISGFALDVILHEASHIALQSTDEGVVECVSWRNRWALVNQFGLLPKVASMVAAGMTARHLNSDAERRAMC